MKIVNVISSCSPGGAEILVKDTLIEMSKEKKNKIELWVMSKVEDSNLKYNSDTLKFEKQFIEELKKCGIEVKFINKRANKDMIKSWLIIRKLYHMFNPDVIHCHLEVVTFHVLMGLLGLKSKKIQTIHNTVINYPKIQKYLFNNLLDHFVSISSDVTNSMETKGIKTKKITEILNGVNIEKFFVNRLKKNQYERSYIAVGRMVDQKNYKFLIKAFQKYLTRTSLENKSNIKLKIVGNGPDFTSISKLILDEKLEKNIELLGIKSNMADILKDADVYLMGSKWEGFSISLIEAAASGLAIIATDVGSNHLIVNDGINGYLTESENEEDFIEALLKMDDKKLEEFALNSQRIAKKYDVKNMVIKIQELYESSV